MTASVARDPLRETGFRLDQLAAAFDRVRDPRDWKAPVRGEIPAAAQAITEQAVRWFTDTAPAFEASPEHPGRLTITAPGYRLGLAGTSVTDRSEAPAPRRLHLI
jgi:hypothetical protein